MAREFWEVFLPQNITVVSVRWDGKSGAAILKYAYKEFGTIFTAYFVRDLEGKWHLEEIK